MTYIVSIKVLSMTEEYKELLWILVVLHFISDQNLCSFNKKKKNNLSYLGWQFSYWEYTSEL